MFEKEIKFISDFSINQVRNLGSSFSFKKLSTTDLHPAILTYISAELDYMIYADRKKLLENSIFDYSGKSISEHFNLIASEIKQNKIISFDDIKKLIIQAVSFNVNYVVRPKWSVTKLIYNDQQYVSVEEMERMLNYLYYYDYIKNVLSAYLSKRKVLQLTLTEFDLILNKIDRELFKANSEELINNALHSIADFFNLGGVEKDNIPSQAVEILLKEKNLMDYLMKLRRAIPDGSKKTYNINDIKNVLYATSPVEYDALSGHEVNEEDSVAKEETGELFDDVVLDEEPSEENKIEETVPTESDTVTGDEPQDEEILPAENELLVDDTSGEEIVVEKDEQGNELVDSGLTYENLDEFHDVFEESVAAQEEETPEEKTNPVEDSATKDELTSSEKVDDLTTEQVSPENVKNAKSEESEKDTEEDELLKFYEDELASMDDEISAFEKQHETLVEEIEKEQVVENKDKPTEQTDISEENQTEEIEETITKEDFDLSIFEEAQPEENQIEKDEVKLDSEDIFDEPEITHKEVEPETEIEVKKEEFSEEVTSKEKEIVNEMLEDFFKETPKDEPKSTEQELEELLEKGKNLFSESTAEDIVDNETGIDKEQSEEPVNDKQVNNVLNDLDIEDEISSVIEDIDKLLEESESTTTEDIVEQTENNIPGEKSPDDELKEEDTETVETPGQTEEKEELQFADNTKQNEKEIEEKTETVEETIENPPAEEPVDLQQETTVFDQNVEPAETQAEAPVREKELLGYLKKKEIKKVVTNVFSGDEEDFVTTVEKISECHAYKEATEILKGVFFTYRVSPYSKEAVILTNAVSNYFRQV